MRIRYPLILSLGLLIAAQSKADGFFDKPAILGGAGVGQLALTDDHFASPSTDPRFNGFDTRVAAWNLFTGFEFNKYLAAELGRIGGGNASQQTAIQLSSTASTQTFGVEQTNLKVAAWHVSAIGSWPINDTVSVFARAGMTRWNSTLTWTRFDAVVDRSTGATISTTNAPYLPLPRQADNDGNDPYYGGGVSINIDSGLIRLEYDLTKINGFDARNINLSVIWRFRPW